LRTKATEFVFVYADDLIILSNDIGRKVQDERPDKVCFCVKTRIHRNREEKMIYVDHSRYTELLLNRLGVANVKSVASPLDTNKNCQSAWQRTRRKGNNVQNCNTKAWCYH
jgi:hypothetical protein